MKSNDIYHIFTIYFIVFVNFYSFTFSSGSETRIRGQDEPQLITYRLLEGVTEPFEKQQIDSDVPRWKLMKDIADQKVKSNLLLQALHEYGYILKNPSVFGEMPNDERYKIFLSMSKLLKSMGFHQKAELLLYEAMSYTKEPHEAHLQLGLLFLEKEDLTKSKMHLKNCLYYKETDVTIMIHLAVILLGEGKLHEGKFYVTRILTALEEKLQKLSRLLGQDFISPSTFSDNDNNGVGDKGSRRVKSMSSTNLISWLEELFVQVLHGDFKLTTIQIPKFYDYYGALYDFINEGEMAGRFIFDLGQSLYEGGKPHIGSMMMHRGLTTVDTRSEGRVSTEIIITRIALDFPLVPETLIDIAEAYINTTEFLGITSRTALTMDIENTLDLYWPLPIIQGSGICVAPVLEEVMSRFNRGPHREDWFSQKWLNNPLIKLQDDSSSNTDDVDTLSNSIDIESSVFSAGNSQAFTANSKSIPTPTSTEGSDQSTAELGNSRRAFVPSGPSGEVEDIRINVAILAGHMNNHQVGTLLLHRFIQHLNPKKFRITLIALPLIPDFTTEIIAARVHDIVNLPLDTENAMVALSRVHADILLFPDFQPFPDQQAALFRSIRLAPVQICLYVIGGTCASFNIDYYVLPSEISNAHLKSNKRINQSATPWAQAYSEQVVIIDWSILTPKAITSAVEDTLVANGKEKQKKKQRIEDDSTRKRNTNNIGDKHMASLSDDDDSNNIDDDDTKLRESEGQIFFEGQPVAILAVEPSLVHPLMDDALLKLLHSVPTLQLVLATRSSFFAHSSTQRHRLSWSRRLARRLWNRGGNLQQRIRLLPSSINDERYLSLVQRADIVLDTYPFGGSLYDHALPLSVGTPVVTLTTGTKLETPKKDLMELRSRLYNQYSSSKSSKTHANTNPIKMNVNRFKGNPVYQHVMKYDVPWQYSLSPIAALYKNTTLEDVLIASNPSHYANLAATICSDVEIAYDVRQKLLQIINSDKSTSKMNNEDTDKKTQKQNQIQRESVADLETFLSKVGTYWSDVRVSRGKDTNEGKRGEKRVQMREIGRGNKGSISGRYEDIDRGSEGAATW